MCLRGRRHGDLTSGDINRSSGPAGDLFDLLLKAGKSLFEHSDGGLNILSANFQNSRSNRIGRVGLVGHPRALLFGGNVVLEKLSASTEIDNQGLYPRFPHREVKCQQRTF